MTGYYRQFVSGYKLTAPLYGLLAKMAQFVWTSQGGRSSMGAHRAPRLATRPGLSADGRPFEVHTGVSNVALDAVLLQRIDGGRRRSAKQILMTFTVVVPGTPAPEGMTHQSR